MELTFTHSTLADVPEFRCRAKLNDVDMLFVKLIIDNASIRNSIGHDSNSVSNNSMEPLRCSGYNFIIKGSYHRFGDC